MASSSIVKTFNRLDARKRTILTSFLIFFSVFFLVFLGVKDFGITWDEAYPNFENSMRQASWFRGLGQIPSPFSRATIDLYWRTTSDHPSLNRSLAALSYVFFGDTLGTVVSLRLPNAIWFALLVMFLFLFVSRYISYSAGLSSAALFMLMPRMFAHAHFLSLDLPVTALWFITTYFFVRGLDNWKWGIFSGIVYGLAITTKLHALFTPFPLLAWTLWQRKKGWYKPIVPMAIISPIMYFGMQPWLWHNTIERLRTRFFHYADKSISGPIPLMYFGQRYGNNTPWHYAPVMILATVPLATTILFFIGTWRSWKTKKENPFGILLMLNFIIPPSLLMLPQAQGYDGTRLFMECFPFMACLAGIGLAHCLKGLKIRFPERAQFRRWATLLLLVVFLPSLLWTVVLNPFQLSYFSEVLGYLPGAYRLGMETTYWCDGITPKLIKQMSETVPEGSNILTMSMSAEVLPFYQQIGLLREDIGLAPSDREVDYALLQCRQGMFGRPEQYWFFLKKPMLETQVVGVPLARFYKVER